MSYCAHCGRTDTIMGHLSCGMVSVGLCHAEPGVTAGAVLARRDGRSCPCPPLSKVRRWVVSRTTEICPDCAEAWRFPVGR